MGLNRLFGLSLFSGYFSPQQVPSPVLSFPEIPSEVWADFAAGWPGIPSAVPAGQSPLVEAERVAAAGSHGEWPQSKEVALVADVVVGEAEPVVKASAKSGSFSEPEGRVFPVKPRSGVEGWVDHSFAHAIPETKPIEIATFLPHPLQPPKQMGGVVVQVIVLGGCLISYLQM